MFKIEGTFKGCDNDILFVAMDTIFYVIKFRYPVMINATERCPFNSLLSYQFIVEDEISYHGYLSEYGDSMENVYILITRAPILRSLCNIDIYIKIDFVFDTDRPRLISMDMNAPVDYYFRQIDEFIYVVPRNIYTVHQHRPMTPIIYWLVTELTKINEVYDVENLIVFYYLSSVGLDFNKYNTVINSERNEKTFQWKTIMK
jgi:hypothetical protein